VLFATGISGLIVPAATVGALGYGYMWWKVIASFFFIIISFRYFSLQSEGAGTFSM
jgi:hypothetical protein